MAKIDRAKKKVDKEKRVTTTRKKVNPVRRYINETVGELRKVTWPTRKEAVNLTTVVLIVTVIMSALLGFLDFLFTRVFALVLG